MWADAMQVLDLEPNDRLEMICKTCGHLRYIEAATLQANDRWRQLYLSEVERRARCRARGCSGRMRMALPRLHKTSGFVGGIA